MTTQGESAPPTTTRNEKTRDEKREPEIDWPTALRRHRGLLAIVVALALLIVLAIVVLAVGIADRLERLGDGSARHDPPARVQDAGR